MLSSTSRGIMRYRCAIDCGAIAIRLWGHCHLPLRVQEKQIYLIRKVGDSFQGSFLPCHWYMNVIHTQHLVAVILFLVELHDLSGIKI